MSKTFVVAECLSIGMNFCWWPTSYKIKFNGHIVTYVSLLNFSGSV